jgi:glutamine amidotransferase
LSADPDVVRGAKRLILPGVGAFGDAMENLRRSGLDRAILDAVRAGTPLLGLCLGLQLLFGESEEFGQHEGLCLIPGKVRKFQGQDLRVPHVGWNQVEGVRHQDPLLGGIPDGSYFYFVHSYYVEPESAADVVCRTEYGLPFCSVARRGNVWGAQFHPEKSQAAGRQLLRNFLAIQ